MHSKHKGGGESNRKVKGILGPSTGSKKPDNATKAHRRRKVKKLG